MGILSAERKQQLLLKKLEDAKAKKTSKVVTAKPAVKSKIVIGAVDTSLANYLYAKWGGKITKSEAAEIVKNVVQGMTDLLLDEGRLNLHGLGVLSIKDRAERSCIDLSSKRPMLKPASQAIVFKMNRDVKKLLSPKAEYVDKKKK